MRESSTVIFGSGSDKGRAASCLKTARSGLVSARTQHVPGGGVNLDVVIANVDVEDEVTLVVLQVDLSDVARGGRLRSRDGLTDTDSGLRKEILVVVHAARGHLEIA